MICKICAFENEENSEFCSDCGAPMLEYENENEDRTNGKAHIDSKVSKFAGNANAKKKSTRSIVIICLAAVLLVAVLVFVGKMLFGKQPKPEDMQADGSEANTVYALENMLYISGNSLYIKPVVGDAVAVSENLSMEARLSFAYSPQLNIVQSNDGKAVYFLENYDFQTAAGTLSVVFEGEEKFKIADNVLTDFLVCKDGSTVLYIADVADMEAEYGSLYSYTKGDEKPQLISDQKALRYYYTCSEDASYISYTENTNLDTGNGELWLKQKDGEAKKISDNSYRANKVFNDGSMMYNKDIVPDDMWERVGTLCYYDSATGESKVLAKNNVISGFNMLAMHSNKFTYAYKNEDDPGKLDFAIYEPNGEARVIYSGILRPISFDVDNENFLINGLGEVMEETGTNAANLTLIMAGKEPEELVKVLVVNDQGKASLDFSTIVYLVHVDPETYKGKLIMRDGPKVYEIADNVVHYRTSADCKSVIYFVAPKEGNGTEMYVYKDGKSKKLSESALMGNVKLSSDGERVFYVDEYKTGTGAATLYVCATGGNETPVLIDKGVSTELFVNGSNGLIYKKNVKADDAPDSDEGIDVYYLWNGRESVEIGKDIEVLY